MKTEIIIHPDKVSVSVGNKFYMLTKSEFDSLREKIIMGTIASDLKNQPIVHEQKALVSFTNEVTISNDQMKKQLWVDAFCATLKALAGPNYKLGTSSSFDEAVKSANNAIKEFDKTFK